MKDGGKKLDGSLEGGKRHSKAEGQQALRCEREKESGCLTVWPSRLLQGEDEAQQFLSGVRNSDIVMLSFGTFLSYSGSN